MDEEIKREIEKMGLSEYYERKEEMKGIFDRNELDECGKRLYDAVFDLGLECPECGCPMDPDQKECECGWMNDILI